MTHSALKSEAAPFVPGHLRINWMSARWTWKYLAASIYTNEEVSDLIIYTIALQND